MYRDLDIERGEEEEEEEEEANRLVSFSRKRKASGIKLVIMRPPGSQACQRENLSGIVVGTLLRWGASPACLCLQMLLFIPTLLTLANAAMNCTNCCFSSSWANDLVLERTRNFSLMHHHLIGLLSKQDKKDSGLVSELTENLRSKTRKCEEEEKQDCEEEHRDMI